MTTILPSEVSTTAGDNTDVPDGSGGNLNVGEGCSPAVLNNAVRSAFAMMAAMWGGMYSGSTRPAAVQTGSFWLKNDATPWVLYLFDGADDISMAQINATTNAVTLTGALTGNVTGNVTGDLTGSVTSSSATPVASTAASGASYTHLGPNVSWYKDNASGSFFFRTTDDGTVGGGNLATLAQISDGNMYVTQASAARIVVTEYNIGTYTPLTSSFTSSAQSLTAGTSTSVAHGLSSAPSDISMYAVCTTTSQGFAVGDIVNLGASNSDAQFGFSIGADATNIFVRPGTSGLLLTPKTSGSTGGMTLAHWDFYLKAYI